jgi:alpha-mannosidase
MTSPQRQFLHDKLRLYIDLLRRCVVRETADLRNLQICRDAEPRFDPPPDDGAWQDFAPGQPWGGINQWSYFRGELEVPSHWRDGRIELVCRMDLQVMVPYRHEFHPAGPEGLLFVDGRPVGAIDRQHDGVRLDVKPGRACDVRAVFFAAQCPVRLHLAEFAFHWIHSPTEQLAVRLATALDLAESLDESSPLRHALVEAVDRSIGALNLTSVGFHPDNEPDRGAIYESVAAAEALFDESISGIDGATHPPMIDMVGHAHLDLAWLWPIGLTRHKAVRTCSTQLALLQQHDEWRFLHSSPQMYRWLERDAPQLLREIGTQVEAGRWIAEGATWVEMDTNIPSGESLVRQFLYGKRYFREQFGIDSRVLWLPDVFGYSAALPQLMKLAEVDYFVTSKISWNQYNHFPHDSFKWRGIDGTARVSHFIVGMDDLGGWRRTYNTILSPRILRETWQAYRHQHLELSPLISFGYGDGGGGPTREHLQLLDALRALPSGEDSPQPRFEPIEQSLGRIAERADDLPVWDGELYLEYHRGTYTSQAWIKRANRRCEIALHDAEWLACLAAEAGYEINREKLDGAWEDLMLMQFHDILPGSSIGVVYDEAKQTMRTVSDRAAELADAAITTLVEQIDTSSMRRPAVLFNTLSWDRDDPVRFPDGSWRTGMSVPAGGWCVIDLQAAQQSDRPTMLSISADGRQMTSQFWRLRFDEAGRIVELYDQQTQRHVLPAGAFANDWQVFEDRPMNHDAWDIDQYYEGHPLPSPVLESMEVVEQSDVRIAVELHWATGGDPQSPTSRIRQRIAMYADHPRIDFETVIDWHEHHQLLKVAFPADLRATRVAAQIQFGHVIRPTHRNTSWDFAQFEQCAQQFVDLAEHGYGVALLNDCKYGYDAHDNVLRLTCIKSAQSPDQNADQGEHRFNYALLPHTDSFQQAGVIRAAAEFNNPVICREVDVHEGPQPASCAFIECDHAAVVIDTLKPAEDGHGMIVRMYESHGSHARATFTFSSRPGLIQPVNLLEAPLADAEPIEPEEDHVTLEFSPFQVLSLKLS